MHVKEDSGAKLPQHNMKGYVFVIFTKYVSIFNVAHQIQKKLFGISFIL